MVYIALISNGDRWELNPRVCAVDAPDRHVAKRHFKKYMKDNGLHNIISITPVTEQYVVMVLKDTIE